MTAATNPIPDVPLPAGAVFGDDWEGDGPERVITGPERGITDGDVYVWTAAIQRADGRISAAPEPPGLHIVGYVSDMPLNRDQARKLAAVLLEAADELDRWTAR
jgi:hypothetical protein